MIIQRLLQDYKLFTQDDLYNFVKNVQIRELILKLISKYNKDIRYIPPVIFEKDKEYIAYYNPTYKNIHVNASFLTEEGFKKLNIKNYTGVKALMLLVFMIGHETFHHYYTTQTPEQQKQFQEKHYYFNALEDNTINNMLLYSVDEEIREFFIEFLYAYYVFNNKDVLTNDLREKIIMSCNPLVHDIIFREYEDIELAFDEIHNITYNKNNTTYELNTPYNRRFTLHKYIVSKLEEENKSGNKNGVLDDLIENAEKDTGFSEESQAFADDLGKEFNTDSNKKHVPILENNGIMEIPVERISVPKENIIVHNYGGFAQQLERIMYAKSNGRDDTPSRSGGSFTSGMYRGDFYRTINIRNSPKDRMVNKFRPKIIQFNDNSSSVSYELSQQIQADSFGLTREIYRMFGVDHVEQYFYTFDNPNTLIWRVSHKNEGYFYSYKTESGTPSTYVLSYLYEKYKKEKRQIIFIHRTDGEPNIERNAKEKMRSLIEQIISHSNFYYLNISLNRSAFAANNKIHKETNHYVNPNNDLTPQLIEIMKTIKDKI